MDIDSNLNVNDIKCVIYKLTCQLTKRVYFGSTKNSLNHRSTKGWYKCSCKDFINMKKEVIYFVENENQLLEKENYYIINFDCVNKCDAILTKERQREKNKNNQHSKEVAKKWLQMIIKEERWKCNLCNICFYSKKKLKRHTDGVRHKSKNESFLKYGEDWKSYYYKNKRKSTKVS
jgi:hypothetical protein